MFENCFKTIPYSLDICTELNAKPQFMFTAPNRMVPHLFIWVITVFHSALIQTNNTSNSLQTMKFSEHSPTDHTPHTSKESQMSSQTCPHDRAQKRKKTEQLPNCHLLLSLHKSTELSTRSLKALTGRNHSLSNVQPTDFLKRILYWN